MSEMSKAARAANKKKAQRLSAASSQKVDASTWSPPEPLDTTAKTGLRPVSRRAYKRGGVVAAGDCEPNMGRKARKSGGRLPTEIANAKVVRNVKDANAEKFGQPHVGGYKKGGRAKKMGGGPMVDPRAAAAAQMAASAGRSGVPAGRMGFVRKAAVPLPGSSGMKKGGMVNGDEAQDKKLIKKAFRQHENAEHGGKHAEMKLNKGGRAHRENGGQTLTDAQRAMIAAGKNPFGGDKTGGQGGTLMPKMAPPMNPKKRTDPYGGDRTPPRGMPAPDMVPAEDGMKKGGRAKRADGGRFDSVMAAAQALQDARRGVAPGLKGGALMASRRGQALKAAMAMDAARRGPSGDELASTVNKRGTAYLANKDRSTPGIGQRLKSMIGMGGPRAVPSMPEASGPSDAEYSRYKASISPTKLGGMKKGGVAKDNYTGGTRPTGGRVAKAGGGRTKGKTNINIVIAPNPAQPPMPPPGGSGPIRPPGMPVVTPPPGMPPGAAGAAPPMPMPMLMPMPAPAPAAGPPPMARKSGGRTYRSYKDMDAGALSAQGRLEKSEIAEHDRTGRKEGGKVGHRNYRSYRDMDAGSLSGMGRLEKTDIAKKKH